MDYESLQQELALKAPLWKKVSPTESNEDSSTTVVYRMDKVIEWNFKTNKQTKTEIRPPPRLISQQRDGIVSSPSYLCINYVEDYLLLVKRLLGNLFLILSVLEKWDQLIIIIIIIIMNSKWPPFASLP